MKVLNNNNWYMNISMDYNNAALPFPLTVELLHVILKSTINVMFGEVSSSLPLDILKFDPKSQEVIVRVPSCNYAKVRAALTVATTMRLGVVDVPVVYQVTQASSTLLALAGPQRII